ncbi:MAG: hypothetical protein L0271_27035, partial [Gemmatimonadetes bacterium]|nr:hypothetical protein [Gemmatimonadota bacterium]
MRSFLISNACYWLDDFHADGLRVDAVASMLYLDYSRRRENWVPNVQGGNQNLEAIGFLKELNSVTHGEFPGTVTLAEESTEWPLVSRPVSSGGRPKSSVRMRKLRCATASLRSTVTAIP